MAVLRAAGHDVEWVGRYGAELEQGAIVTTGEQRVRIRPPDVTQG